MAKTLLTCLWYMVSGALYCIAFEHNRKTSLYTKDKSQNSFFETKLYKDDLYNK